MRARHSLRWLAVVVLAACEVVTTDDAGEDGLPATSWCNGEIVYANETDGPGDTTDEDQDGVVYYEDCNDCDATLGSRYADRDCDGVDGYGDCNDVDEFVTSNRWEDPDCDGVGGIDVPMEAAAGAGGMRWGFRGGDDVRGHLRFDDADVAPLFEVYPTITAISFRLDEQEASSSLGDVSPTFDAFTVRLGTAPPSLGGVGDAFADHHAEPLTTVRSGPLDLAPGSMPAAGSADQAAPWGVRIDFDAPYVHQGGPLLVEVVWTRAEGAKTLWIDAFDARKTFAGGSVFAFDGDDSVEIESRWDANWALALHTEASWPE